MRLCLWSIASACPAGRCDRNGSHCMFHMSFLFMLWFMWQCSVSTIISSQFMSSLTLFCFLAKLHSTKSTLVTSIFKMHCVPGRQCMWSHPFLFEMQSTTLSLSPNPAHHTTTVIDCSQCETTFCSVCIRCCYTYVTTLIKPKLHRTILVNECSLQSLRCMLLVSLSPTIHTVSHCT